MNDWLTIIGWLAILAGVVALYATFAFLWTLSGLAQGRDHHDLHCRDLLVGGRGGTRRPVYPVPPDVLHNHRVLL
jgi:hypothetical protein